MMMSREGRVSVNVFMFFWRDDVPVTVVAKTKEVIYGMLGRASVVATVPCWTPAAGPHGTPPV